VRSQEGAEGTFIDNLFVNYVQIMFLFQEKPDMAQFFKSVDIISPIGPREAFFGGRTNAIRLYHKCKPDNKSNMSMSAACTRESPSKADITMISATRLQSFYKYAYNKLL